MEKGDRIELEETQIKFHASESRYFVIIKRKSSDAKLLEAFKKSVQICFSVNSEEFVTITLNHLPNQKAEIHFELRKDKLFLYIEFQNSNLLLNHNRYQIRRFSGKNNEMELLVQLIILLITQFIYIFKVNVYLDYLNLENVIITYQNFEL